MMNNIYNNFREDDYMRKSKTLSSLSNAFEDVTDKYIPLELLTTIWECLDEEDKIIFGDDSYEYLIAEFVSRGAYKHHKHKKNIKLKKSFRVNFLNNSEDWSSY